MTTQAKQQLNGNINYILYYLPRSSFLRLHICLLPLRQMVWVSRGNIFIVVVVTRNVYVYHDYGVWTTSTIYFIRLASIYIMINSFYLFIFHFFRLLFRETGIRWPISFVWAFEERKFWVQTNQTLEQRNAKNAQFLFRPKIKKIMAFCCWFLKFCFSSSLRFLADSFLFSLNWTWGHIYCKGNWGNNTSSERETKRAKKRKRTKWWWRQ